MPLGSIQALCLANFFMADIRDGLGPFLGIFLTEHHWDPDGIGWVMSAGGIASLVATLPAGLAADASRQKKGMLVICTVMITFATLMLWYFPAPTETLLSQMITGLAAALIAPLLTAVTLGLTGPDDFGYQMGRNEAYNHCGNMTAAMIAGGAVWFWGTGAVFVLMTMMAFMAGISVIAIREDDIDDGLARGLDADGDYCTVPGLSKLVRVPALLITGITLLLFHLGNAALLPMLSVRVAASQMDKINPGIFAAATVIISQGVMIPVALYAARKAQRTSYFCLITAALCILPLRAVIASVGDGIYSMPFIQILDGLAAGLLGVAVPGYVVRLLRGKGHTNAGQSFIMLMQGVGAACSPALTGALISRFSYSIAFAVLGGVAMVALIVWYAGVASSSVVKV